jgi:alpha-glucosidase (family GH31 glycosyl hydrolase)
MKRRVENIIPERFAIDAQPVASPEAMVVQDCARFTILNPRLIRIEYSPNEYYFGSELLAAPFTAPHDPDTGLSRTSVWLPAGDWFHFTTGEYFAGDQWITFLGKLDDIPVFAKAGAIIPLGPRVKWGGIEAPKELRLELFPGADNRFVPDLTAGQFDALRQVIQRGRTTAD